MKKIDPLQEEWFRFLKQFERRFNLEGITPEGILFLVGVNVLGKGVRKFSRQEKEDVIHVGMCEVLTLFGYFEKSGEGDGGWPRYDLKKKMPRLGGAEQERLVKLGILEYFKKERLIDGDDRSIGLSRFHAEDS